MMENDKEKWIDDVFDSIKGSERAKPSDQLFANIESEIDDQNAKIIPVSQWRMAAAAAVFLLILNGFALNYYSQNNTSSPNELAVENTSEQSLISNYQIYE